MKIQFKGLVYEESWEWVIRHFVLVCLDYYLIVQVEVLGYYLCDHIGVAKS